VDEFLIQVTHLYYQRNMNQSEIARLLNVSKMTVSRALKKAQDVGLVTITVNLPVKHDEQLSHRLKKVLQLQDAFVVKVPSFSEPSSDAQDAAISLGEAAAFFLDPLLQDGMVIGVAVGSTVGQVARSLHRKELPNATVVQLIGGLGKSSDHDPYNIVQSVSERLGAHGIYFTGPAFVASPEILEAMKVENSMRGFPELWKRCDLCLVGIGTCEPTVPFVTSGLVDADELRRLCELGAVGDLLGRYYRIDGTIIDNDLHERVNAIPIDTLRGVKNVVLVAGGLNKVEAIIGASRIHFPFTLITDEVTARAVLASKYLN